MSDIKEQWFKRVLEVKQYQGLAYKDMFKGKVDKPHVSGSRLSVRMKHREFPTFNDIWCLEEYVGTELTEKFAELKLQCESKKASYEKGLEFREGLKRKPISEKDRKRRREVSREYWLARANMLMMSEPEPEVDPRAEMWKDFSKELKYNTGRGTQHVRTNLAKQYGLTASHVAYLIESGSRPKEEDKRQKFERMSQDIFGHGIEEEEG